MQIDHHATAWEDVAPALVESQSQQTDASKGEPSI
jgi:hypothetical protein